MHQKFSGLRFLGMSILIFLITLAFAFFFILPFNEKIFKYTILGGLVLPIIFFGKKLSSESSERRTQSQNDGNSPVKDYFKEYDEAEKKHREKTSSLKYFLRQIGMMTLFSTIAILIAMTAKPYHEELSWYIAMGGICIPIAVYFIVDFIKMIMRAKIFWNCAWAIYFPEKKDKE